jgi:SNF family Na+-dependent transporter
MEYMMDDMVLNIDKCIQDKTRPAIVRQMFADIQLYGYLNIGKFFEEMADADLQVLMDMAERLTDATEEEMIQSRDAETMMLFGIGLAVADGLTISDEQGASAFNLAVMFITLESLSRKGLIRAHRENWTFDPTSTATVATSNLPNMGL